MKRILTIVFILTSLASMGQTEYFTPVATSYEWNKGRFKTYFRLPLDTIAGAENGALAWKNGALYVRDSWWKPYSPGGGSGSSYFAGWGLGLSGSTFAVDSFVLQTRARSLKQLDSLLSIISSTYYTKVQSDGRYSQLGHTHTASQVTDLTASVRNMFSAGTGISYNASTGVITATGGGGGGTYSFTAPLTDAGGTVSMTQAGSSTNGYLSAVDWTLFNSKVGQGALNDTAAALRSLVSSSVAGYVPATRLITINGITHDLTSNASATWSLTDNNNYPNYITYDPDTRIMTLGRYGLPALTVDFQPLLDSAGGGSSLPSMTGNGGKYLTTDGSTASWGLPPGASFSYATVYVDSAYGNDATGTLARADKPFQTIAAAVAALPTSGGIVYIGRGSYTAPTSAQLAKDNVAFIGSGQPVPNWTVTQSTLTAVSYSTATKLLGGTIIRGTLSFINRSGIKVKNLGIDVGSDYVAGGGTEDNGLAFYTSTHNEGTNTPAPAYGLYPGVEVDGVTILLKNSGSMYHALLLQTLSQPTVNNVTTIYGVHGIAIKTFGGSYTNLRMYYHGWDGLIVKSNNYAVSTQLLVDNFHIYGSGSASGVIIQNNTSSVMQDILLTDGFIYGGTTGVETIDNSGGAGFAGVVLNNVRVRGASTPFSDTTDYALIDCWADDTYKNIASAGSGGGADVTPPTLSSIGTASATTITAIFSEPVTATTAGWSFKRNGAANAVSSVSGSGTAWTFTVADAMAAGETLLYSYNPATGATTDGSGNELASATDGAVTNNISGGGGGTTLHHSTFTAADATALSAYTPETGNPWAHTQGAWVITSGQATSTGAAPGGNNWLSYTDVGQTAYTMTTKITRAAGGYYPQLWVKATDAANAVIIHFTDGQTYMYNHVGGVTTEIANAGVTLSGTTEHTVTVVCTSTTVSVSVDGVEYIAATTIPTTQSGTKVGIAMAGGASPGNVTFNEVTVTQ